jgi:hypothetical protein
MTRTARFHELEDQLSALLFDSGAAEGDGQ